MRVGRYHSQHSWWYFELPLLLVFFARPKHTTALGHPTVQRRHFGLGWPLANAKLLQDAVCGGVTAVVVRLEFAYCPHVKSRNYAAHSGVSPNGWNLIPSLGVVRE